MFFLVSGAAASGKSTVTKGISTRLDHIECHDCDEKLAVDEYTRCQQLEEWIACALEHQQQGQDFLLTTHSPLGELLACPSATRLTGISACLLDCHDPVRITRMRDRGIDPNWPPTQHTLNWAAWHRMHAWDPQWEPHVIVGNGPTTHIYDRWRTWKHGDERWQVTVIDTTLMNIEHVLDVIVEWIEAERKRNPLLSPETQWWK